MWPERLQLESSLTRSEKGVSCTDRTPGENGLA